MKMIRNTIFVLCILLLVSCSGGNQNTQEQTTDNPPSKQQQKPAAATETSQGKNVYVKYCLVCHQSNGKGVPGLYPPINETDWVNGDKQRLITLVLNGQEGPIEVKGETYNNVMPAQNFLSNQEVAAVLTYIRSDFGNDASAITEEEVAQVRQELQSGT